MAGSSTSQNSCDMCGIAVPLTQQRCATHIALATTRIAATYYSTVEDERGKKNGKN